MGQSNFVFGLALAGFYGVDENCTFGEVFFLGGVDQGCALAHGVLGVVLLVIVAMYAPFIQ
jgi:hypothetical protein